MSKPWFDKETNTLLLDEYVMEMPSFKKIIEDNIITDKEMDNQVNRVIEILKQLESILSDEQKEVATEVLCELSVLYALAQKSEYYIK